MEGGLYLVASTECRSTSVALRGWVPSGSNPGECAAGDPGWAHSPFSWDVVPRDLMHALTDGKEEEREEIGGE